MLSSVSIAISCLAAYAAAAPAPPGYGNSNTVVRASTGYYTGTIDQNFTNVRKWLDIPYGVSTSGRNRWMPPVPVPMSSESYDSTNYPPSCPQFVSAVPAIWNQQIPQYLVNWGAPNNTAGISAPFASEDCLKLAIWTPANATSESLLPVAMFWTGGGFQTNGIDLPGQIPTRWVSRSQEHIVITINYRMNIMGFPNAAGVEDQNLGLLDQRVALEWVRDNIVHFGGDPGKIIIWGQSAGAAAVDIHNYAFYEDPIARGIFAESGAALTNGTMPADYDHTNFTFVAKHVGCDHPYNGTAELECMQKVPYDNIINFFGQYQDNSTLVNPDQPRIAFSTITDEKIVYGNTTARYLSGKVSRAPAIYSGVANEGGSLSPYPVENPLGGINQTAANQRTLSLSVCPDANTNRLRDTINLPTYRYQYAGNWSNQDPLPWMGAFHSSDLVMLFGTYDNGEGPVKEPLEAVTSETMEDYVLAFVKDPWNGPASVGWFPTNSSEPNGGTMLRFGANGKAVQNITASEVEVACFSDVPYSPFP